MGRPGHIRIPLVFVLCLLAWQAGMAFAAEAPRKTRAMREQVYEKLSRAQVATEAGDWARAQELLAQVEKMKDLAPQEKAQLFAAYGYVNYAQEKYAESAAAYGKVLAQDDLPDAMRLSTLYTLGQLNFHLENYEAAVANLRNWLQLAENPGPEPYILLGQALYQLGRLTDAVEPVQKAVRIAAERGQEVKENWYALLRVIYYETKDYDRLLPVLKTLAARFPSKEYWVHLSSAYGEKGDVTAQLAAYEAAYAQGYLTTGSEVVLLCQLLLQANVPYRAGTVLQGGLTSGVVAGSAANWRLLSQAWTLAKENEAAIVSLTRAAEMSTDGELHARLAQAHASLNQWDAAAAAAGTALDRGVKNPQELQMLQGMAYFELGRFAAAKAAFGEARKSEPGRQAAARWLDYVEREEARLRELGLEP